MPLVLPHELLNALHTSGRLCDLCDAESLTAFWDNFKGHESSQVQWPRLGTWGMIPMGVHGDDFRYLENGGKITAFSMNILTDDNQERFPLFAIRVVAGSLLGCCVLLFFLNYVEASLNPSILNSQAPPGEEDAEPLASRRPGGHEAPRLLRLNA